MPVLPLYAAIVWLLYFIRINTGKQNKYKHVTLLPTQDYSEPNLNKLSAMFLVHK